jgi:hypothetical protein
MCVGQELRAIGYNISDIGIVMMKQERAFPKLLPQNWKHPIVENCILFIYLFIFISPLFNQVGKLRTSSHLQLRPGQDKAKQFDRYNDTELHME